MANITCNTDYKQTEFYFDTIDLSKAFDAVHHILTYNVVHLVYAPTRFLRYNLEPYTLIWH